MNKFLLTIFFLLIGTSLLAEPAVVHTLPSRISGMPDSHSQKESVVCVHAFLRSYRSLKPMGHVLERENYDVFIWNYETRKFTLEQHAEHLVRLLKQIAQAKPGIPINFVTHSVGGVIVRVALSRSDCPEEAKKGKAILMAPPNAGSTLARRYRSVCLVRFIFGGKLGRQLLTYTPEQMLNVGKIPSSVDVLVLSGNKSSRFVLFKMDGENDGKVRTTETQLDTPHHTYVLNTNHTYIIADRKSLFLMKEFLKHGSQAMNLNEPELVEKQAQEDQQNSSRLASKKKQELFIIHCFGSHPYNLYGFPKKWPTNQQKSETNLGTLGK